MLAAMLSAGHAQHMCGIMPSRVAKCWGRGAVGQLGTGSPGSTGSAPTIVTSSNSWADVFVGRLTTCGVTTGGAAFCWGHNQRGEGGNTLRQLNSPSDSPVAVEGGIVFKALTLGWLHTCGLSTEGVAYCWGDNRFGQLGLGVVDNEAYSAPVAVTTSLRFEQLSAGANYTCGITTTHLAYCWGQNVTSQLGDGTADDHPSPTAVSGGLKFAKIAASTGFPDNSAVAIPSTLQGAVAHTCALTEAGAAYCWGWNAVGQLGDGTTTSRIVPVAGAENGSYPTLPLAVRTAAASRILRLGAGAVIP